MARLTVYMLDGRKDWTCVYWVHEWSEWQAFLGVCKALDQAGIPYEAYEE
jgi:hypothetical protein